MKGEFYCEKKSGGKVIDEEGRCTHYHQENDIVALKCSDCEKYFSCYHCHDWIRESFI